VHRTKPRVSAVRRLRLQRRRQRRLRRRVGRRPQRTKL